MVQSRFDISLDLPLASWVSSNTKSPSFLGWRLLHAFLHLLQGVLQLSGHLQDFYWLHSAFLGFVHGQVNYNAHREMRLHSKKKFTGSSPLKIVDLELFRALWTKGKDLYQCSNRSLNSEKDFLRLSKFRTWLFPLYHFFEGIGSCNMMGCLEQSIHLCSHQVMEIKSLFTDMNLSNVEPLLPIHQSIRYSKVICWDDWIQFDLMR